MFLVKLVKALSLQLQQVYAGSLLSFVTASKNIFQLTLDSEQSTTVFKLQLRIVPKIKAPYFTTFLNVLERTFINLLMHLHITQFTCK